MASGQPPALKAKRSLSSCETYESLCPREKKFIPDRVCGDIPFHQYRSMFLTPPKYIQFIKQLEQSRSRHDFIFWIYDIIAGGSFMSLHSINANKLDEICGANPIISRILDHTFAGIPKISWYLLKTYPMIFKVPYEKIGFNPELFTVRNDDELFKYRVNSMIKQKKFLEFIHDEFFYINPMQGLSLDDLPKGPAEISYEDFNKTKAEYQSFFSFYHYFHELLFYHSRIPNTTDFIFVDKNPYKVLQIEKFMENLDADKIVKIDAGKVQELNFKNSIVLVRSQFFYENAKKPLCAYKRARILNNDPPPSSNKVLVLFLDYGKISTVSLSDIFTYKFEEEAPKFLTKIIPENKFSKTPKRDDMFAFDYNKMKYFFVGRESKKFDPISKPNDDEDSDEESIFSGINANDDWENEGDSDDDIGLKDINRLCVNEDNFISPYTERNEDNKESKTDVSKFKNGKNEKMSSSSEEDVSDDGSSDSE